MGLKKTQNQYQDGRNVSSCSGETETVIDEEVRIIFADCQTKAEALLQNNNEALERIADYLLEKENITGEKFMELLKDVDEMEKKS